jgi:hypothetical protein
MHLPNGDHAIVDETKVRDYLLSASLPVSRFKAVFFHALGFSQQDWTLLRDALLDLARTGEVTPGQPSPFGQKFEIHATLQWPSGRTASVVTVWMAPNGLNLPHFITAFPG